MKHTPAFPPSVVPAANSRTLHAFGETVIIHLAGEQTNGQLALWTEIVPPGGGPPPHVHLNEDEWFLVQEGSFEFLVNGQWQRLEAGGSAFLPKNSVHTFKNTGNTQGRLVVSTSPAGFETFFSRCAEVFNQPEGPDMARITEIAADHGIHFVAE